MVKLREALPTLPGGSIDIPRWLDHISEHRSKKQIEEIHQACLFSEKFGSQLFTPFGEPCFHQGLKTADVLHDLGLDTPSLVAALVFLVFRYGQVTIEKIEENFGKEIVSLVLGLQKIDTVHTGTTPQTENLRRLLLFIVQDVRVVIIKLALLTCEMQSAIAHEEIDKRPLAKTIQEIYAPLANRLGIGQLKWELEDLAFRFSEPKAYKQIASLLDERRIDREHYIAKIVSDILKALQAQGIEANVFGRVKHIYGIWKKMQRKGVGYHEIYDVRAVRIIVSSIPDCYAALGVMHTLWQHIPKEFDDYIANPKKNNYRSLHTAVIGPEGKTLEIQIRTQEMHDQAELGIAAHWRYKEKVSFDSQYEAKLANLRQVLKWQEDWPIESSFDANSKAPVEVLRDRIYVLTPKGDVIDLILGATVLDFAYHIHTDVGHRCRGAKVNGRMVPLTKVLNSGDRIEILTAKSGGPSRDWLNRELGFLKSPRARTKVLQWFKRQDAEALETLTPQLKAAPLKAANIIEVQTRGKQNLQAEILVSGVGNLLCQMARCCKPVPGDEIMGYITLGRGVSIHRKDCLNIVRAKEHQQPRLIQAEWGKAPKEKYLVEIAVKANDREGLLRDIAAILATDRIAVLDVNTKTNRKAHMVEIKLSIEISGIALLNKILTTLHQLPNVIEVYRVQG